MAIISVVTGDNADLIAHLAPLYIPDGALVRDVTWGKGVFWRKADLTRFSLQGSDIGDHIGGHKGWDGHVVLKADFTALPDDDASTDVVVLDPPYIHNPSSHSTDARYNNVSTTGGFYHRDIRDLYVKGMREAWRILKPGGRLLVKCKDQVESGVQCWAHIEMLVDAEQLGFYGRDLFVLVPTSRTSMNRWDTQLHARKVHSFLWVFDKPEKNTKVKTLVEEFTEATVRLGAEEKDENMPGDLEAALEGLVRRLSRAAAEEFVKVGASTTKRGETASPDETGVSPPKRRKTAPPDKAKKPAPSPRETVSFDKAEEPASSPRKPSHTGTPEVRRWLKDNGYPVKPSGRISHELMEIYISATKKL